MDWILRTIRSWSSSSASSASPSISEFVGEAEPREISPSSSSSSCWRGVGLAGVVAGVVVVVVVVVLVLVVVGVGVEGGEETRLEVLILSIEI